MCVPSGVAYECLDECANELLKLAFGDFPVAPIPLFSLRSLRSRILNFLV